MTPGGEQAHVPAEQEPEQHSELEEQAWFCALQQEPTRHVLESQQSKAPEQLPPEGTQHWLQLQPSPEQQSPASAQ